MPVIPKPRRTSYKNRPSGTHFLIIIITTIHFFLLRRHSDGSLPPVPRRGVGAAVSKKQKKQQQKIGGKWGSHGERKLKLGETRSGCGLKDWKCGKWKKNCGRWEQRHAKLERDTMRNGNWKWWVLIVHGFNRWVCVWRIVLVCSWCWRVWFLSDLSLSFKFQILFFFFFFLLSFSSESVLSPLLWTFEQSWFLSTLTFYLLYSNFKPSLSKSLIHVDYEGITYLHPWKRNDTNSIILIFSQK